MSADICMCNDHKCPMRKACYRYTAPQSEYRQTWFAYSPLEDDGTCEWFWDNDGWGRHEDVEEKNEITS